MHSLVASQAGVLNPAGMAITCVHGYGHRTGATDEVRALRRVAWLVRKGLLAQMREQAGLSQSDVARYMGIAPSNVSRWESGAARPRADRAVQLLRLLEEP